MSRLGGSFQAVLVMSLSSVAYRVAKASVARVPAGWLRLRPYRVYAATLGPEAAAKEETAARPDEFTDLGSMRVAATPAEAADLAPLTTAANIASCDGRSRWAAVTRLGGRPIACLWIAETDHEEPELGVRHQVRDDEAWLFAAVVDPSHRRRGVYRRLLRFACGELASRGKTRLLFSVAYGNDASQHAHNVIQPRELGTVFATRSLGWTLCATSGRVRVGSTSRVGMGRGVELAILPTE